MSLYKSLLKVQEEIGSIKKDETNPFFNSSYVSLNAVRESVVPLLSKNGLVLIQPTVIVDGQQYVCTTIIDSETGDKLESHTAVITKSPNDAQQVGSGISYARRYGLMSLLCLAAEDDDGNSASQKAPAVTQRTSAPVSQAAPAVAKKVSFANKKTVAVSSGDEL